MTEPLFEVFGHGDPGQKIDDLNAHAELLESVDLRIPRGFQISSSVFDEIVSDPQGAETILKGACPSSLLAINESLLQRMQPGTHYAIRSSARSESGGNGIYKTTFFFVTGNHTNDMDRLWQCETTVYTSEFTEDAVLWREKQNASIGMSILIQPVSGTEIDGRLLPTLSGTAYTSLNGLLTVRCVIGLGTRAVEGDGIILFNAPSSDLELHRISWQQESIDMLDPDGILHMPSVHVDMTDEISTSFPVLKRFFEQLTQLAKTHSLYLEWTIYGDRIDIVQCSKHQDSLPGISTLDPNEYFHLMSGNDVVGSGEARCTHIVFATFWSERVAGMIAQLNREMKHTLLIVVQDALSELARDNRIALRHFSNANAVVEMQWEYTDLQRLNLSVLRLPMADHTQGSRGATHFAGICQKSNILFLGGRIPLNRLWTLGESIHPRNIHGKKIEDVHIWHADAVVKTDAVQQIGSVYISKRVRANEYSHHQIVSWSSDLRNAANRLNAGGADLLANHFYRVHYAIAPGNPSRPKVPFDPFELEQEIVQMDGMETIRQSLQLVLQHGSRYTGSAIWNNGLGDYLRTLEKRLSAMS